MVGDAIADRVRLALAEIGVPATFLGRVLAGVVADLGAGQAQPDALLESVYFHVYTDSEIRQEVNFNHPLDSIG